jgi:predicted XRE-type DNA-binding protein
LFGLTKAPEVTEEQELNRAALRQQDVVTQLGTTPDKAQDLMNRVMNAATADELTSIIQGN